MAEAEGGESRTPTETPNTAPTACLAESGLNADGELGSSKAEAQPRRLHKPQPQPIRCPECGSERLYKDGHRYLANGEDVQRYLCRNCGYRFSDPHRPKTPLQKIPRQSLNNGFAYTFKRQACDETPRRRALATQKRLAVLAAVETATSGPEGATEPSQTSQADVKGKIIEYAWWMQRQGYSPQTVESRIKKLKRLVGLGANLLNPEDVKDIIAKQPWKTSTKAQVSNIYGCFAKLNGLEWEQPVYKPNYELPFIPTEAEIDQLVAACGRKLSALLQLLKETGIRIGEACRLRWIDLDVEQRTLRVHAEKNSKPRIFHVSDKLLAMLSRLPKKSERMFPNNPRSLEGWFRVVRNRLALKLGNPRLKEIHFHTMRHWRATMLYHQTKDILHVKEFLGHRSLDSTLTYINIERAIFSCSESSEFHVKVAKTPEEIKSLLEVGFEYVCEKDGLMFFRKRK
jgi:integrase